nr:hypothetical protein [Tanacetum cinerariifolium]
MLKALLSNKEKLQELANIPLNENCSAVILKKLPKKLGDPGKFLIPSDFVIVDYESDPRVPLILGRTFLRIVRALIDVHGEKMILRDDDERLTLNMRHDTSSYSNQPQKESINLINVINDSNEDFLEDFFSTNHQSGNPTFSSYPKLTLPKVKDDIFDPKGGNVLPEKLLDLDYTKDLYPPHHVNTLSGNTTSFSSPNQLLEEFTDELALITFPSGNDDLQFDIKSDLKKIEYLIHHDPIKDIDSILKYLIDPSNLAYHTNNLVDSMPKMFTDEHALDYSSPPLYDEYDDDLFKEIEFLLYQGKDSSLKDSIDQTDLANLDDYFIDPIPEMFTNEHAPDYSSPPRFDVYDDDFLEVESDADNVYDDPFDSKGEKIKESKLLIDELGLPCDFFLYSEYDSFNSQDFFKADALPSPNNEDKVKEKQEKDKIEINPDQIKIKREAWKSPASQSLITVEKAKKEKKIQTQRTKDRNPKVVLNSRKFTRIDFAIYSKIHSRGQDCQVFKDVKKKD